MDASVYGRSLTSYSPDKGGLILLLLFKDSVWIYSLNVLIQIRAVQAYQQESYRLAIACMFPFPLAIMCSL